MTPEDYLYYMERKKEIIDKTISLRDRAELFRSCLVGASLDVAGKHLEILDELVEELDELLTPPIPADETAQYPSGFTDVFLKAIDPEPEPDDGHIYIFSGSRGDESNLLMTVPPTWYIPGDGVLYMPHEEAPESAPGFKMSGVNWGLPPGYVFVSDEEDVDPHLPPLNEEDIQP